MRILGIDPGLNICGYGVVDESPSGLKLVEAGVIRTKGRALDVRLGQIYDGVVDVIKTFQPAVFAIEELYSHYERPRTAILMGHARGVICLAAQQADLPISHYAATQIKRMLTGNGRAPKSQVQNAVTRELRLIETPSTLR